MVGRYNGISSMDQSPVHACVGCLHGGLHTQVPRCWSCPLPLAKADSDCCMCCTIVFAVFPYVAVCWTSCWLLGWCKQEALTARPMHSLLCRCYCAVTTKLLHACAARLHRARCILLAGELSATGMVLVLHGGCCCVWVIYHYFYHCYQYYSGWGPCLTSLLCWSSHNVRCLCVSGLDEGWRALTLVMPLLASMNIHIYKITSKASPRSQAPSRCHNLQQGHRGFEVPHQTMSCRPNQYSNISHCPTSYLYTGCNSTYTGGPADTVGQTGRHWN